MGWIKCSGCGKFYNSEKGGCQTIGCSLGPKTTGLPPKVVKAPPSAKKIEESAVVKQEILLKTSTQKKLSGSPTLTTRSGFGSPPPVASPFGMHLLRKGPKKITKEEYAKLSSDAYFDADDDSDTAASGLLLYRGDTRPPNVLKGDGGFKAYEPLSLEAARNMVKRGCGVNCAVDLPIKGGGILKGGGRGKIVEHRLQPKFRDKYNIRALGGQIKLEKANDTFHISTDLTEACGGYSSGNIYRISFNRVCLFNENMVEISINEIANIKSTDTYVLLDNTDIDQSSVVALVIGGNAGPEVSFLTSIPMEHIVAFKIPQERSFHKITI